MFCWCLYASHHYFLKAGLAFFALWWYLFLRLIFVLSWRSSHGRSCRCLVTFRGTRLCMIFISPLVKVFQFSLVSLDGAVVMKVSRNEAISLCSSVTLALLYMNIFCTGFLITLALSRTSAETEQWSLMLGEIRWGREEMVEDIFPTCRFFYHLCQIQIIHDI